ncbi:MAG TPA: ParB/RepB/Spo0J family partition protein, partial [Mycobacteriales bacterium]|nr:ParB/RepB/Spo0J family partition protein [Mycobacteriales bacterium]
MTDHPPTPTAADRPPPAPTLQLIPIGQLTANPLNLRRRLSGIDELAESIRQVGILEPLLAAPAHDGGLLVVAGHRRLAAAAEASLQTVPCIVRERDEAQIIQTALIENGHRQNLTYVEEADGLQQYMTLTALQVKDLAARVGRTPQHVSARLSLLTLPEVARDALDTGTITLDTALALTELTDYPDLIAGLFDGDRIDADALAHARRQAAVEREVTRLTEEATAKGLRLAETLPPGARWLATLDLTPQQQAAHRRRTCHTVVLDRGWTKPQLVPACTDPDRHTPPPAAAAKPTAADANTAASGADQGEHQARTADARRHAEERQRAEAERERNHKRVAKARRRFLTAALGKRIKRADATIFVLGSVLGRASHTDLTQAAALLGLTAQPDRYGQKDWHTAVSR